MNRHRTKYLLLIVVTALGFIIANSNYQFQFELVHAGDWETVEYIQGVQDLNFVPAATGNDYVDYVQTSVYGGWQNAPPYGMALDSAGPAGDSHLIELSYTETTYPTKTSYTGGSLPSGWSNTYWTFGASYASILGWSYTFGYFTTNTHDMTSYLAVRIKFSWCNYGGENTDLSDLFIRSYEGSYQTVYQTPAGYRVQFLAITVDRAWHSTGWKVQFYATDLDQGAETCEGFKLDNIYLQGKQSSTYWRFQAVLGFSNIDYHWDKVTLYVDFYTALTGSDDLDFRIETGDVTPDYLVADNKQNDFSVDVSAYVTGTTVYLDIRDDYRTGDTVQTYAYIQRCYLKLENTAPANDGVPTISNPDDTDNLYSRLTKYEVTTYHKDVDGFGDIDYVLFMVYDEEWGTMYFYGKFIQDTHEFSELAGYTGNWELDLAGSTYSEHDTDELDITWKFYVEWECADITDMNVRPYVVDESGLIDNDWNAMTWDVETDLEYDVTPTITDDDAGDADRGDPDETFHITGDVSYQGSSLTPPSGDVDVMVACTVGDYGTNGGPWEDDTVDAGGAFDVTCYADDEVGIETYTIRVVKEGTGYGGTDLVIGADPTDTYIADQLEITWFVASDNRTNIGTAIEIRVKAIYDYNDVEVSTGTITLNGTYSATWDAGNSWFDYTTSAYSTVGERCFNITAAIDSTYGVTGWVWHTGVNPTVNGNYLLTNVKDPWKLQTFTLEMWYMSEDLSDFDTNGGIDTGQAGWRTYSSGTNGGYLIPYRNQNDPNNLLRFYIIYTKSTSGTGSAYKQYTFFQEWTWYHLVYSVNSTGYLWIYVNGVLQDGWQASDFQEWCYVNPTNGFIAGSWGDESLIHVDEVRFHNVAFDADRAYKAYHGIHTTTGLVSYWPMDGDFLDHFGSYDCTVNGAGDPISHGEPVSIVWDSMMVSYSLDESREDVGSALRATATISYAFDQWAVTGLTTTWSPSGSVTDVGDGTYYVDYTKNYVCQQDTCVSTISGDTFGITVIGNVFFDASNDWIDCGDLGNPAAGTIALWFLKYDTGVRYLLDGRGTGNWWFLTHYLSQDVNFNGLVSWNGMAINTWYHVIVTADSSETKLYINGVLEDTGSALSIDFRSVRIATRYTNSGYFSGQMRDFRIYGRVIDSVEAYELYQGHYSDNTDLLLYYPTSSFDLDDSTWHDMSGNNNDGTVYSATANQIYSNVYARPIWDGLMVNMWVSDGRDDVGDAITIYANFTYAWDGTLADVSSVVIEAVGGSESAPNLWYISQTRNYVVSKQYAVDSFTDDDYGLTQILWWHVDTSTSEYVNVPDHADLKPAILTVATWIRLTDSSALRHLWCTKWNGWSCELDTTHHPYFRVTSGSDSPKGDALVIGDWYFYVGVYDPSVDAEFRGNSLFINGVRVGTTYDTDAITHSTYGLDIGKYRGGLPFGGNVRDVRIYNRALTAAEILLLYYGQEPSSSGLVLHLTPNSWNIEDDTWYDMSGLGHDGTIYGDEHEASTIDPVFVNPVWDALAFDIYLDNDRYDLSGSVTITCKAVYTYDGTTFTDADGSTLTFDTFGAASYSGGLWTDSAPNSYIVQGNYYVSTYTDNIYGLTKITSGFYFDGSDDRLSIPHDSSQTALTDFTIEGWFYAASNPTESKVIVAKAHGASRQFMVWFDSSERILFVYKNVNYYSIACSPTGLAISVWHHFVITIDGTTNLNAWYDGIHYQEDYTMAEGLIQRDVNIYIGCRYYSPSYSLHFHGYISHLRMYSRALSDNECYSHYQRYYEGDTGLVFALTGSGLLGNTGTYGKWIDSTANDNDATAYNGAGMFQNSGGDKRVRPIWDTVSWELWVDDGRVNADADTVRVWFDAVYAYDGIAFEGSVTIEGNAMTPSGGAWYYDIPAQSVGQYTWDTIDITDSRFGLNDEHAGLYFDGSNDYATIVDSAALNTNQDFSVSVWFYYSGDGTAGKVYWTIAAKNNVGAGNLDSWHFYVAQTTHHLKCRVGGGSAGLEYTLSSGVDVFDSNWHMATLTYDHSERQFKLFLDGYLKESYDAAWDCVDNADVIRLGSWNGYGDYYKGYISEILHWSRTLADEEVFLLYTGQYSTTNLEMRIDGLSFQYKETYEMADRIASHDLNTAGPRIYDLSSVEKALPVWDIIGVNMWISEARDDVDDTITVYSWLTYLYDATNVTDGTVLLNGTGMSYSNHIWSLGRSQSTIGMWSYNVTSVSGNAFGITVVGWNEFNGADETDYVNAPDSVSLSITGSITVSAWIYIDSYMTDQPTYYILSKGGDGWGSYHIRMDNNTNLLRFIIGDPASQWGADSVYLTEVLSTGEWHLITGVWDSDADELRIYWNGVLNNTDPTTYASIYDEDVYGLTLGCLKEHYYYFNGSIDSVRIYNRSLSTIEIHELHQCRYSNNTGLVFHVNMISWNVADNTWYDLSGEGNDATIYGPVVSARSTYHPNDDFVYVRPIWDAIGISMWISDARDDIDNTITVNAWLTYLYDGTNVTDGTVLLNGTGMSYGSSIWSLGRSQSTVGLWAYNVTAISGNTHGITVVGTQHFDGSDDYITFGSGWQPANDFSAFVWIRTTQTTQGANRYQDPAVIATNGIGGLTEDWALNIYNGYLSWFDQFGGASHEYQSSVFVADGTWHLVGFVRSGSNVLLYVDGILIHTVSSASGAIRDHTIYLGKFAWSGAVCFDGTMGSARVYSRTLDAVEIYELYQGRYSNDTDLILNVHMPSLDVLDNTWYDLSIEGNDGTIYASDGVQVETDYLYVRPIWDRLVVSIQADEENPLTGATVTFTITVTYEYDSVTCTTWTVNVQRNSTADWASRSYPTTTFTDSHATPLVYQYLANSALETIYGITVFSTNTETVEWHNQIPFNVSLSVDYDDTDNMYARYRYYEVIVVVGDADGYENLDYVILMFRVSAVNYWRIQWTQSTDTFAEIQGYSYVALAAWSYSELAGNQATLHIIVKIEWAHGVQTDEDWGVVTYDDEAEYDSDTYADNQDVVCALDYTVTPTVTDAVADGTRGDISGSLTGAGTVIYYGSGDNYPLANETDVWILHDVSGTWSDDVDGSGAFSRAMTADSSVRESTYTIKVVIEGAGSGGTDLYYTTTVTDTYISDSLTITITDPTDPEQRIDLNANATGIVVSAVCDYDSATYDGTFVLNSTTFSYATVGKRGYTVSSASGDDSFGITAISTNDDTYCIWDEMLVLYILADDDVSYFGQTVNFTIGLQYKYDSDNVQTGTFSLEALALAFSSGANWTTSDSHGTSGTWLYNDVTGTDGAYSLTGIDMDSNTLSVVWDTIVLTGAINYDWTLVGHNLTITTTGVFQHLGYTWNGTATWNETAYPIKHVLGNYTFEATSITEPDYGVTTFVVDYVSAIWDTVNCSRSALYWKNTLDADWLYLDTAAFFFGFNGSGLTENFKIQSYYGYPDASTSSDYAYVNDHSQIDRLIIGNFSGAGMDTINASYSAVCTILGEPEYRIWSYNMSYLDVRNVVYEDTVFVDAGARAYILNNEEVRNQIHIVLYNNSMIAGSYAEDDTSIWVRILAYRDAGFPSKNQIWSSTKALSTNMDGTVVWSLRNWDAWNICNKWNTATSPFIYIHYSTVSSGGPWTFINAFHALGSNYNLDPYNDATWTVDLERSQVLVESDWSPDRENLTAWMESDGLTPYGYGEFAHYEWINAENWNRYVWEALVTIWADFGAPIGGPAPMGEFQYVIDRRPIDPIPLGIILMPLTGWQRASGVDDISYFWLDVFPQWAFWYEEDGQWYQTGDYDISLWLRTRLENNILWSPWYQKLSDPNNYETGQHLQENLMLPFDYRNTELSIAGERVALSGDITFSFDYTIYENDVDVGSGSVNITPTLNVWSQFAIYWDRQQGTGNVNYSIYCDTTAYESWSAQSLWINGTYSKAEPPSGFTIEQFEVEYDDVYVNIYCETNWANSTLYLYVDGSLKATSAEADIIQYRKSMTEGTHSLNILIDAGSETRWRNYTYAIGVDAITLKIIEFEWDTGSPNTYSCFVRTNWGNATVRLLEDGNTRFMQTEVGKGMSFKLSKVQRFGVHTVTLQIDAGGQILTYVLGYSYREPDHPSDTPDVGPMLSVIGDELSDSLEDRIVIHPALIGFFVATAFMAVIIIIIVFKWLLKEPII